MTYPKHCLSFKLTVNPITLYPDYTFLPKSQPINPKDPSERLKPLLHYKLETQNKKTL